MGQTREYVTGVKPCKVCGKAVDLWPMAHRGDRCCSQECEKQLQAEEDPGPENVFVGSVTLESPAPEVVAMLLGQPGEASNYAADDALVAGEDRFWYHRDRSICHHEIGTRTLSAGFGSCSAGRAVWNSHHFPLLSGPV